MNGIELDNQMLALFDKLRIGDKKVIQWMQRVIAKMKSEVSENSAQLREIHARMQQIDKDRDELLSLRMHREIEADTYAKKDGELRKLMTSLKARQDGQEQQKTEIGDTAMKVLELSQCLKCKWLSADIEEKRLILEILCLNLTLKGSSLEISMRKPFDSIAEGLALKIGSIFEARVELEHFFKRYNGERPHQSLSYQTPDEVYYDRVLSPAG